MADDGMQKYLLEEMHEDYRDGWLDRRKFLRLVALISGGVATSAYLAACAVPPPAATSPAPAAGGPPPTTDASPTGAAAAPPATAAPAAAAPAASTPVATPAAAGTPAAGGNGVTVSPEDPAIRASMVEFAGKGGSKVMAYLARPGANGTFPGVLVNHENRGLTEHIKDVARRLAKEGFVALAVDLVSREGGTARFTDSADVTGILGRAAPERLVEDLVSGVGYLKAQADVKKGGLGAIGFCFGGGTTWRLATASADIAAAVPFYGPNPPLEQVPALRATVFAVYAERDQRITGASAALADALTKAGKNYEFKVYPNSDHAFFNDTGPRHNKEAAADAWSRSLALFRKVL